MGSNIASENEVWFWVAVSVIAVLTSLNIAILITYLISQIYHERKSVKRGNFVDEKPSVFLRDLPVPEKAKKGDKTDFWYYVDNHVRADGVLDQSDVAHVQASLKQRISFSAPQTKQET